MLNGFIYKIKYHSYHKIICDQRKCNKATTYLYFIYKLISDYESIILPHMSPSAYNYYALFIYWYVLYLIKYIFTVDCTRILFQHMACKLFQYNDLFTQCNYFLRRYLEKVVIF